ncbi:MAG: hypothetical protein ACD_3C00142G0007 [uncultured bacterium (gcode 4)]|uniref:Uncharacterized protein n=1 Tax=uncultured bacterium (gcode 4) TaxID=1234023 RepID=K2F9P4_9BACT|nr:MAG: hypothetical protein ACD_3C00142G0007 [uncultured bacterium (gcode 4)]
MPIENFKQDDILKKKEKLSEKELKEQLSRQIEFQKEKNKLLHMIEKDRNLNMLRSIVERWLLRPEIVKRIIKWEWLDIMEIGEVLKKIDEISNTDKIDKILPKEMRVSKEEYLNALEDTVERDNLIEKLNGALDHLYLLSNPFSWNIYDMFSWLFLILNKNLIAVQDKTVEIKLSLLSKK